MRAARKVLTVEGGPARGCVVEAGTIALDEDLRAREKLDAEHVDELEATLRVNPADIAARGKLLRHFARRGLAEPEGFVHLEWMIEHCPVAPILGAPEGSTMYMLAAGRSPLVPTFEELWERWRRATERHPDNPRVLGNAARFVLLKEPTRAAALFERAAVADPTEARWLVEAAQAYRMAAREHPEVAARELDALERAHALTSGEDERWYLLDKLARAALRVGRLDEARVHAETLLAGAGARRDSWNYGNAIHDGHLTLGEVALARGDEATAVAELLAAGDTPGSPQLNSFGPNMMLARALLERGVREPVLEYLAKCRRFWDMGRTYIDGWLEEVRAGRIPTFKEATRL